MALAFDWSIFIHRGTWRMFIYAQNDGREKSRRDTTTTSLLIIITHFAHVDHHMHLYNSSILSLSLFHSISLCLFIHLKISVCQYFVSYVCLSVYLFLSFYLSLFVYSSDNICMSIFCFLCLSVLPISFWDMIFNFFCHWVSNPWSNCSGILRRSLRPLGYWANLKPFQFMHLSFSRN